MDKQTVVENWRERRDAKLYLMLNPEEPAWLVSESVDAAAEVVLFDVVHRWAPQGWQRRRYLYDMISDVIHFRGSSALSDAEITKLKPEQRLFTPAHLV